VVLEYVDSPAASRASPSVLTLSIRTILPPRKGKEHEVRVVALDPTYLALAMLDDTRHDGVANRLNVLCQR
jgi:hypothetical protein